MSIKKPNHMKPETNSTIAISPKGYTDAVQKAVSPEQTQPELTFENFMLIVQGHSAFQLLWAGVNFKIFDILNQSPTMLSPAYF